MKPDFSKNNQISNFRKVRPVGAELFHLDWHDLVNTRFSQFRKHAKQWGKFSFNIMFSKYILPFMQDSRWLGTNETNTLAVFFNADRLVGR